MPVKQVMVYLKYLDSVYNKFWSQFCVSIIQCASEIEEYLLK